MIRRAAPEAGRTRGDVTLLLRVLQACGKAPPHAALAGRLDRREAAAGAIRAAAGISSARTWPEPGRLRVGRLLGEFGGGKSTPGFAFRGEGIPGGQLKLSLEISEHAPGRRVFGGDEPGLNAFGDETYGGCVATSGAISGFSLAARSVLKDARFLLSAARPADVTRDMSDGGGRR